MACPAPSPRTVQGVTIDASTTLDIDDGVSVRQHPSGGWTAQVTIAAVAAAVPPGSLEDQEARARVATRYLPVGHKPMLAFPTERRVSLAPHRDRAGLTLEVDVSANGDVTRAELYPSRFESLARLSYPDVPAILATQDRSPVGATLAAARALALTLLARRRSRGALALYDLHHGWVTDEEGRVHKVGADRSTVGYVIVQELMILANAETARIARDAGVPILYRVHGARAGVVGRDDLLAALASAEGATLEDLEALVARVDHQLERARYSAEPSPHWGLSLDLYTHATSPIRRYADLVTQRQLWAHVHGRPLPYTAGDLAETAAHIQRVLTDREERAQAQAEKAATTAGATVLRAASVPTLTKLDDARFERVLKVAVRSGEDCPPALRSAFTGRLFARELPLLCMVTVLFESPPTGEGWATLRTAVVEYLAQRARHDAPSILATAASLGLLPEVVREVTPDGAQGPFSAQSRVALDSSVRVATGVVASRKKVATATADVALIATLSGVPLPRMEDDARPGNTAPSPGTTRPTLDPAKHPVSLLNELLQALRAEPPVFLFEEPSPQRFVCECGFVVGDHKAMARGSGTTKTAAKTEAARRALDWLVTAGVVEQPAPENHPEGG